MLLALILVRGLRIRDIDRPSGLRNLLLSRRDRGAGRTSGAARRSTPEALPCSHCPWHDSQAWPPASLQSGSQHKRPSVLFNSRGSFGLLRYQIQPCGQATSHGRLMAECLQASGNVLMRPQLVRLIRHLPANGLDASLTLLHG